MTHAHGAVATAARHIRRTKRSTGRLAVSALGFSAAYFLDAENGAARRRRLQDFMRRTAADLDEVLTPELGPLRAIRPGADPASRDYVSTGGVRLVSPW
jgi:hypothetical protein